MSFFAGNNCFNLLRKTWNYFFSQNQKEKKKLFHFLHIKKLKKQKLRKNCFIFSRLGKLKTLFHIFFFRSEKLKRKKINFIFSRSEKFIYIYHFLLIKKPNKTNNSITSVSEKLNKNKNYKNYFIFSWLKKKLFFFSRSEKLKQKNLRKLEAIFVVEAQDFSLQLLVHSEIELVKIRTCQISWFHLQSVGRNHKQRTRGRRGQHGGWRGRRHQEWLHLRWRWQLLWVGDVGMDSMYLCLSRCENVY